MTNATGPHFILSGDREGASPYYQGTAGVYWSSSAHANVVLAYYLGFVGTNSAVYPTDNGAKPRGRSLRCLAQNQTKNKKPSRLNKNKIRKKQNKGGP